jgi:aryl-alcohol dehydrogenase-like predicted oxidoreductase
MQMRNLGKSELSVSLTGMGVSNFGMRDDIDPDRLTGAALDAGINFFDTADVYSQGRSEMLLGAALKHRRTEAIIATKWGGHIKGDAVTGSGGTRSFIVRACEASLRRLGTSYIDLYQFHQPDPATPIEETIEACDALIRAGKVRYIGLSNMPAWQVVEAQLIARQLGKSGFISCQDEYSLLARKQVEGEKAAAMTRYGLSLLPFFPLASGMLTGKYRAGEPYPEDSRFAKIANKYERFRSEQNWRIASKLQDFATVRGHSLLELAFSWLAANPLVGSIIAGATRPEQVVQNIAATGWALSEQDLGEIDEISTRIEGDAG